MELRRFRNKLILLATRTTNLDILTRDGGRVLETSEEMLNAIFENRQVITGFSVREIQSQFVFNLFAIRALAVTGADDMVQY
jgi:hypothetical protein